MNKINVILKRSVPTKDQLHLIKRLGFLLGADIPLMESLSIINHEEINHRLNTVTSKIMDGLAEGKSLHASMENSMYRFDPMTLNLINIGEHTGQLTDSLNHITKELREKISLKKKMYTTLIYPLFIVIFASCMLYGFTYFIFPKLKPLFSDLNISIPLYTRVMLSIFSFFSSHIVHIISIILILGFIFNILYTFKKDFRTIVHKLVLRLPLIGLLIKTNTLCAINRNIGTLLKSKIPISESYLMVSTLISNEPYKIVLALMTEHISTGESSSDFMLDHPFLFPYPMPQLIRVGEKTGNLPLVYSYLSDLYKDDSESLMAAFSSSVEPILMVIIGSMVGAIAVSILTPIYEISQKLHP